MRKPNPGRQPPETRGKRVRVWLVNGEPGDENGVKPGWAADTCSWIAGDDYPFNIAEYEVIS